MINWSVRKAPGLSSQLNRQGICGIDTGIVFMRATESSRGWSIFTFESILHLSKQPKTNFRIKLLEREKTQAGIRFTYFCSEKHGPFLEQFRFIIIITIKLREKQFVFVTG